MTDTKFKPGDKVVCIRDTGHPEAILGEIYTIESNAWGILYYVEEHSKSLNRKRLRHIKAGIDSTWANVFGYTVEGKNGLFYKAD